MVLLHLFSIIASIFAIIGITYLIADLTVSIFDDWRAGFLAGISIYILPGFLYQAAYGIRVVYFFILCGLLAVYFARSNRPFVAGLFSAVSVGFYQTGAVFAILTVGLTWQSRRFTGLNYPILGWDRRRSYCPPICVLGRS